MLESYEEIVSIKNILCALAIGSIIEAMLYTRLDFVFSLSVTSTFQADPL